MAGFRFFVSHPKRRTKPLAMLAAAAVAMLACVPPAQAAETTPLDPNPGPAGNFTWKGLNWEKRFWAGAPQYNKAFAAANVGNPDANGYITMNLTNPTGEAPVGAEFQSTRQGFGYGTYSTTVEKNLAALQKEVVWGCLFTYDPLAEPGHTEIDLCEASAWGGGAAYGESWPVTQGHGYWFDATKPPGEGNNTTVFGVTSDSITTHRMVWEPGRITFETFAGEGYTGALLKRTVLEGATVPVPARERIHFNLWVTGGGGGDPAHVKPESVVIRDFSFVSAATAAPTGPVSAISLSAATTKAKSVSTTTLKWTGATGTNVTLWVNGVQKSVANTGTYVTKVKGGSSTAYKVCDAAGCSNVVSVVT
ncbi:hypothetical protein [Arthrobacter sp. AFG7.2]|uniref:hypothetical protein n=1 Tax=Arthrobacter sp. AFG7.2 TaxID=1688693 RepID=UPI00166FA4F5|nr:hypothetical protein [Arthrobacter sp. AFG7.2]